MIDRAASANFLAGGMFGGALLIAAIVLALVILIPIGRSDWHSFINGVIVMTTLIVLIIGLIGGTVWLTQR